MTLAYLVQHAEKEPLPGDPGLTGTGREQATCTGRWLCGLAWTPGPVAVVTDGGITVDLLRNLLGDDGVPAPVLAAGIPPCAVTAVDDRSVVMG